MSDQEMRACGSCTLCCKLLAIEQLNKPAGQWCEHCRPGRGCSIYKDRPSSCREYVCLWKTGTRHMGFKMRPDRVGAIVGLTTDQQTPILYLDPDRPHAWEGNRKFRDLIRRMGLALSGRIILVRGNRRSIIHLKEILNGITEQLEEANG